MKGHLPQEQISAWLDGQLDGQAVEEVENHLPACEICRSLAGEFSAADELFRAEEPIELPPYLWSRISAALSEPARKEPGWLQDLLQRLSFDIRRQAWAAAAMLVVILGGALSVVHYQAEKRFETATLLGEIDSAHAALIADNSASINPFQAFAELDSGSNPFAQQAIGVDPNPFRSLRSNR